MLRKFIALLSIAVLIFASAISAQASTKREEIIWLEDGSRIRIVISEDPQRAAGAKSGKYTYTHENANGEALWKAVLTASFTYNGTTSTCTSASCSVTVFSSSWYEVSKVTTRSGDTARTELTMGKKLLGVTVSKPSFTLLLTCDKNGNLS